MKRFRWLYICALLLLVGILAAQNSSVFSLAEQDSTIVRAPVIYEDRVIFYIYSSQGTYSPLERAVIVGKRLEKLSLQKQLYRDSLNILETEEDYTIRYAKSPIFTISRVDSLILQQPLKEIAIAYHEAIINEFIPHFTQFSLRKNILLLVRTIALAFLVLILTGFLFRMLKRLTDWLHELVRKIKDKYPNGYVIKGIRFLTADQFDKIAKPLIGLLRFLVIVIISYFSLYFLLLAIPPTRMIAHQLQAYITNPLVQTGHAILNYLPNLFFIAVVIIITRYVLRILRYFFNEIENGHIHIGGFYTDWADSTYHIVKFFTLFFVVVIIFPYLPGSGSPAFQGISIFVGVLVSLGSSSAIANIIAGIILTYMRPFQVGDFVRIGDRQGILIETALLVLRIKTVKNEEVNIPNSIVLGGNIVNYTSYARAGKLLLHTKISIRYDVPWQKVYELLVSAALRSYGINKNKPPFVNVTDLMDHHVVYELNAYTETPNSMPLMYSELHRHILDTFTEAGIEIISPMYNAIRDGSGNTVPSPKSESHSESQHQ